MPSVCLALETSSATCSVALSADGVTVEDTRALGRTHNEHLLGMIDGLCQQLSIEPRRIEAITYSAGPGSFTGVRIAASAAMAISLASDARLLAVNSLLALAAQASHDVERETCSTYLAIRRSRKDAYYLAAYRMDGVRVAELLPPRLVTSRPELPQISGELSAAQRAPADAAAVWKVVGEQWPWEAVDSLDESACGATPSARTLLETLADPRFAEHLNSPGSSSGLPVYVGGSDGGDHPWRFTGQ